MAPTDTPGPSFSLYFIISTITTMYMVRGMKRHWDATLEMTVDDLLEKYDSEGGHVEENDNLYLWYLLKVRRRHQS